MKQEIKFSYDLYESSNLLNEADQLLVKEARQVTEIAYAPYSGFKVGAVARMTNGELVKGTNQENASYPVGICAERALLASASMLQTQVPIDTIAISYNNTNGKSQDPVAPCGMCRQALLEYEERTGKAIRLVLTGMEGKVVVLEKASQLLPLSFGSEDLK